MQPARLGRGRCAGPYMRFGRRQDFAHAVEIEIAARTLLDVLEMAGKCAQAIVGIDDGDEKAPPASSPEAWRRARTVTPPRRFPLRAGVHPFNVETAISTRANCAAMGRSVVAGASRPWCRDLQDGAECRAERNERRAAFSPGRGERFGEDRHLIVAEPVSAAAGQIWAGAGARKCSWAAARTAWRQGCQPGCNRMSSNR